MKKYTLEFYINVLDRFLEREGFSESERDEIIKDEKNIEIITDAVKRTLNPYIVYKKLLREPAYNLYDSLKEALEILEERRKDISLKKFKKVMKEFGEGKLKPYRSKSYLKPKKMGGTEKEYKQALAIAFSETSKKKK